MADEQQLTNLEDALSFRGEIREQTLKRYGPKSKQKEKLIEGIQSMIADRLTLRLEVEQRARQDMEEDEAFYTSSQTHWDKLLQDMPVFRKLKLNTIANAVDYTVGMLSSRNTMGLIIPANRVMHASQDEARKIEERIIREFDVRYHAIQDRMEFQKLRHKIIKSACTSGVGYFHHGIRRSLRNGKFEFFGECPNWRNVYTDGFSEDMNKAEFAFIVERVGTQRLLTRFPDNETDILNFSQGYSTERDPTRGHSSRDHYNFGHILQNPNGFQEYDRSRPDRQVAYGRGYFFDEVNWKGRPVAVCLYTSFVCEEDFSEVKLLTMPTHLYGHNEIPICQVKFGEEPDTGFPFSTIVRHRRGLERAMNSTLRTIMRLQGSRGVIVNMQEALAQTDMTDDEIIKDYQKRLSHTTYALPEYGAINSLRVENYAADLQKHSQFLVALNELSKQSVNIHPTLQGEKTSVTAGTALDGLRKDTHRANADLHLSIDFDLIKRSAEQILSHIEQFNRLIDFGTISNRGQLIQLGSDGDLTIAGNKARFQIIAAERERIYSEDQLRYLEMFLQRASPEQAMPFIPFFMQNARGGNAEIVDDMKAILMKMGLPIAPSMLTQDEAKMVAQQEQAQAEARKQAAEIEMDKVRAETEAVRSRAEAQMIQASEPSQSQRERDMEAEIIRLTRLVHDLTGNAQG